MSIYRNCSGKLEGPRDVSIIGSVHCISVCYCSVCCISEALDTCTIPPSSDAAAAIEVHRAPYNIPEKEQAE